MVVDPTFKEDRTVITEGKLFVLIRGFRRGGHATRHGRRLCPADVPGRNSCKHPAAHIPIDSLSSDNGRTTIQMSTITALVKLPCILAVTAGIHTFLTVPGRPSKAELVSISGMREMISACGLKTLPAMKVRKGHQTT